MSKENNNTTHKCSECDAACCKYVSIEIDTPNCKRDYDTIRWHLIHKNVRVFIDNYNAWHVEFRTPCNYLTVDNKCSIYENRPKLCRDYPDDDTYCEHEEDPYSVLFSTVDDFDRYMDRKGVDWRWKKVVCDFSECAN